MVNKDQEQDEAKYSSLRYPRGDIMSFYFQKVAFKHFPDLHQFAIANVASVDTRKALLKYFKPLR